MSIYNKIQDDIQAQFFQQNFANDGQSFVAWYLRMMSTGQQVSQKLKEGLVLKQENFEYRLAAD